MIRNKGLLLSLFVLLAASFGEAQQRCAQVFSKVSAHTSWAQSAVEKPLDVLEDFFVKNKNLSDVEKTKLMMKEDMRKTFFRLQALARMLEPQGRDFFREQREYFKSLEDATGKLDLAAALRKEAEQIGNTRLVAHFQKQEVAAQRFLLSTMRASGLWNKPEATIAKLKRDFVDNGNWETGSKEREFLIKIISNYAKDLHKSVKENEFDNADIEKGLHELRRRLRWILIQAMSLDGFVQLQSAPKPKKEISSWFTGVRAENPELLIGKFMRTSSPVVDAPILVPQSEFALITDLVSKIGKSKDSAEMQIYFKEAMEATGASVSEKNEVLKKLDEALQAEAVDHRELARQMQSQLAETKLLKEFAENLEKMN